MRDQQTKMHSEVSQKCVTSGGAILDVASTSSDLSSLSPDSGRGFAAVSQSGSDLLAGICTRQSYLPVSQRSGNGQSIDFQHAVLLLQSGNDVTSSDVPTTYTNAGDAGYQPYSDSDTDGEVGVEPAGKKRKLQENEAQSDVVTRRRRKRKRFRRFERESRQLSDSESSSESECEVVSDRNSCLKSDTSVSNCSLTNCTLTNCTVSDSSLTDCTLFKCNVNNCTFSNCTLSECSLTDCPVSETGNNSKCRSVDPMSEIAGQSESTHIVPLASDNLQNTCNTLSDSTSSSESSDSSDSESDSDSSSDSDTSSSSDSSSDSGAESDSESEDSNEEIDLRFHRNPCPRSCPCKSGEATSRKLPPIKRKETVDKPLYRKLMLCRLLSRENRREKQCCEMQCHSRWAAKHRYPASWFKIEYDDVDDLHVQHYSWGRWTPPVKSEVTDDIESNPGHQVGKTGGSTPVVASCSSDSSVSKSDANASLSESDSTKTQQTVHVSTIAAIADDLIGPVSDSDTDSESDSDSDDVSHNSKSEAGPFTSSSSSTSSDSCRDSDRSVSGRRSDEDPESDSDSGSDSDPDNDSDSDSDSDGDNSSSSSSSDGQSDSSESGSESEADDPFAGDSDRVIDVRYEPNPCPKSCPCSRSFEPDPPTPIRRRASTRKPLYESLLRDRLLRRGNMERYACCVYACQDSWLRRYRQRRRQR